MCIAFFIFSSSSDPKTPRLLLCFNRDEFFDRPTQPLAVWDDCGIIGGRDLEAGGTWLGWDASGRLAFLTNLRSSDPIPPSSTHGPHTHASRGNLTTSFLSGDMCPIDFAKSLQSNDQYHGFNLVVGDLRGDPRAGSLVYTHNASVIEGGGDGSGGDDAGCAGGDDGDRGGGSAAGAADVGVRVQPLEPGRVYGLSNGQLLEWPKVTSGVAVLQELLPSITAGSPLPWDRLYEELLGDSTRLVPPACEGGGAAAAAAGPAAPIGEAIAPDLAVSPVTGGAEAGSTDTDTGGGGGGDMAATGTRIGGEGGNGDDSYFERELEHLTSGRFVAEVESPYGKYGTRSQTILVVWHDGSAEARERHRGQDGEWRETCMPFRMQLA